VCAAVTFKGETKRFTPEEISSMILAKMREIAQVKHLIVICVHQSSLAINPSKGAQHSSMSDIFPGATGVHMHQQGALDLKVKCTFDDT
jgi:hypothetical protein